MAWRRRWQRQLGAGQTAMKWYSIAHGIVVSSDLRALWLTFDRFCGCSANVQARQTIHPKSFSRWLLCPSERLASSTDLICAQLITLTITFTYNVTQSNDLIG